MMETNKTVFFFFLLLLLLHPFFSVFVSTESSHENINRSQFPSDFFFGVSTSSYQVFPFVYAPFITLQSYPNSDTLFFFLSFILQIEGAVSEDGRGLNTWDLFTHTPGAPNFPTNHFLCLKETDVPRKFL